MATKHEEQLMAIFTREVDQVNRQDPPTKPDSWLCSHNHHAYKFVESYNATNIRGKIYRCKRCGQGKMETIVTTIAGRVEGDVYYRQKPDRKD